MARLSSSVNLGTGSVSSLIKSANSLATQELAYQDAVAAQTWRNSAYTDAAFSAYTKYLKGRITAENSLGTISGAQKALSLSNTLETAMRDNTSANIARANIAILSGNASDTDKLNLIGGLYSRAVANGDMTSAQSLMSQYYTLSQKIQYDANQAASARATLAKAGGGSGSSGDATYQGQVFTNLNDSIKYFEGVAKNSSEAQLNQTLKDWVQGKGPYKGNDQILKTLGVNIKTQQPNYFDVVSGIIGAMYNAKVLQAQADAFSNPLQAKDYAMQAANIASGATTFKTLAGDRSFYDIQQMAADPQMTIYNSSSGKYEISKQSGWQYEQFTDPSGKQVTRLVPQYSGYATNKALNNVYFLTPQETTLMTKLGLDFGTNKNQTTGTGVFVQTTDNTPSWLKAVLVGGGEFYTDKNGQIIFKGQASSGQGFSYFTLATDYQGRNGLLEHLPNGTIQHSFGDFGFDTSLLINSGIQRQAIQLKEQAIQQQIALAAKRIKLPTIVVPHVAAPRQTISVPRTFAPQPVAPRTIQPQAPSVAPGVPKPIQTGGINVQGGNNFNLQGAGPGSISL